MSPSQFDGGAWGERGGTTGARAAPPHGRRSVATDVPARLAQRLQRSRPNELEQRRLCGRRATKRSDSHDRVPVNATPVVERVAALGGAAVEPQRARIRWDLKRRQPFCGYRARCKSCRRRLLRLSFGRWLAHDNHASEGCLYLASEVHMGGSTSLPEGSL